MLTHALTDGQPKNILPPPHLLVAGTGRGIKYDQNCDQNFAT